MAKAKRDDLNWQDVDTDAFKGTMAKTYKELKAARLVARELGEKFDTMFRNEAEKKLDDGESVLISHKFGKMSIAVVDKSEVAPKASKAAKFRI